MRKRHRAAALQNLADEVARERARQRLGVRLSSAAFLHRLARIGGAVKYPTHQWKSSNRFANDTKAGRRTESRCSNCAGAACGSKGKSCIGSRAILSMDFARHH